MAMKSYKPTTPGRRAQTHLSFDEITKTRPEKSLTKGKPKTGGRGNRGRVTSRFIGGGHKQRYRQVDFRRDKRNIPATVAAIEYDPNRSARIALLNYRDGEKRYIIAPDGLQVGNLEHENVSIGKAGRTRHLGKMPHNRGVSMNPVDHPLGGGEGKTSGGRHPVSPWGQPTKGYKTRRNKRTTKFIVKRRGKK